MGQLTPGGGGGTPHGIQTFQANGNFTPQVAANLISGAGGGSGGGGGGPAVTAGAGGGGGSGGACVLQTVTFTVNVSVSVTIATGGAGGANNATGSSGGSTIIGVVNVLGPGAPGTAGAPGTGGTYGGESVSLSAGPHPVAQGTDGQMGVAGLNIGGAGGRSAAWGVFTKQNSIAAAGADANGSSYVDPSGNGGNGGATGTASAGTATGGNGAPGYLIVQW